MSAVGGRPRAEGHYSLAGAIIGLIVAVPWGLSPDGEGNWDKGLLPWLAAPAGGFLLGSVCGKLATTVLAGRGLMAWHILRGGVAGASGGAALAVLLSAGGPSSGSRLGPVFGFMGVTLLGTFIGVMFGATLGLIAAERVERAEQAEAAHRIAEIERQPAGLGDEGVTPGPPAGGRGE